MTSCRLIVVAIALVACAAALTSAKSPLSSAPNILGCPGAPWCPVWVNCSYTDVPGASCYDCNTRVICTPAGGMLQPCSLPFLKNCVNGQCRRTPSTACSTEAPTEAVTEAVTEATTEALTEGSGSTPQNSSAPL